MKTSFSIINGGATLRFRHNYNKRTRTTNVTLKGGSKKTGFTVEGNYTHFDLVASGSLTFAGEHGSLVFRLSTGSAWKNATFSMHAVNTESNEASYLGANTSDYFRQITFGGEYPGGITFNCDWKSEKTEEGTNITALLTAELGEYAETVVEFLAEMFEQIQAQAALMPCWIFQQNTIEQPAEGQWSQHSETTAILGFGLPQFFSRINAECRVEAGKLTVETTGLYKFG